VASLTSRWVAKRQAAGVFWGAGAAAAGALAGTVDNDGLGTGEALGETDALGDPAGPSVRTGSDDPHPVNANGRTRARKAERRRRVSTVNSTPAPYRATRLPAAPLPLPCKESFAKPG
jgi:hypothetical protein